MKYLAVFLIFLFFSCAKSEVIVNTTETGTIVPIDIRAPKFFWLIQPWKEGKLATIDGWGRFAEISFVGANRMRIKHLVNFPRTQLDRELITWPETGLIASNTADRMHHLAAIDDGKTKSHIPMLTWQHTIHPTVLLDAREGLVGYFYSTKERSPYTNLFVYNYKEDKMVYESPREFNIWSIIAINDQYALSYQKIRNRGEIEYKAIFYNWRTNEVIENELTKTIDQYDLAMIIRPYRNIHLGKRYLFSYSGVINQHIKVSWDEEYSDVTVTPLSYLVPGKGISHFILSQDGKWGSTRVWGYRGLYGERLYKRAFFHLDGRYPNGISMPVITEDYENNEYDYSAFVNHSVHGLCYAQEWHKNERGRDRLYLRLYKMDDVLAEINRQLQSETQ